MNYLLDTHVLLWWLSGDPQLPEKTRDLVSGGIQVVYVSAASIWEIRIKQSIGKLELPANFRDVLDDQHFDFLDITADHTDVAGQLPQYHRDPFDRMLIAQAQSENLKIITHDAVFKTYDVAVSMV